MRVDALKTVKPGDPLRIKAKWKGLSKESIVYVVEYPALEDPGLIKVRDSRGDHVWGVDAVTAEGTTFLPRKNF